MNHPAPPSRTHVLDADAHRPILDYYDEQLRLHGDTAQGAGWPNEPDRQLRFQVMAAPVLAMTGEAPPVVCDLGCGTGELLTFLRASGRSDIRYIGADRSAQALALARAKHPAERWIEIDVTTAPDTALDDLDCDYLIANGLFTVRHSVTQDAMWAFMTDVLQRVWPRVRRGLVFNVMSPIVDWERDDLFHVSHDKMARFLHGLAGRHVQMRADYGLYEYTCLAFKPPSQPKRSPMAAAGEDSAAVPAADVPPRRLNAYRPLLPTADLLAPYLRRMDKTRTYSNHGPLVAELEHRLSGRLGVEPNHVVSASSGTAALVASILATAGRATAERPYALCPSYTFVGTASALQQCGYVPWLVDVDEHSWQMDPGPLASHPRLAQCGVVVPVAANGRAVPLPPWESFRHRTGLHVVVDGAASIEGLMRDPATTVGTIPVALSFHATKVFATGEGGAVVTRDTTLALAAFRALNFGFLMSRESHGPSFNGKMSEHHAAVGLAGLDRWPQQQAAFAAVLGRYRQAFAEHGLDTSLLCHPDTASNYVLFRAADGAVARQLSQHLASAHIESRWWYGQDGLHGQPNFAGLPRDELPVTHRLAACLVGLPMAPDLTDDEVDRVAQAVHQAVTGPAAGTPGLS